MTGKRVSNLLGLYIRCVFSILLFSVFFLKRNKKRDQIEAAVTNARFYLGSDIPKSFGAHAALASDAA
jgi:hypothetical protein